MCRMMFVYICTHMTSCMQATLPIRDCTSQYSWITCFITTACHHFRYPYFLLDRLWHAIHPQRSTMANPTLVAAGYWSYPWHWYLVLPLLTTLADDRWT